MSLVMKGITIPMKIGAMHLLGERVDKLIMDGVEVWRLIGKLQNFITSGEFVAPPGVTTVRLCGSGAGGGGSSTNMLGGSSGEIASEVDILVTPGNTYTVNIGIGGVADGDGGTTTFGTLITLQGGLAGTHQGEGADRTTCGGTHQDGILVNAYYGGQASTFGDGGDGDDGAGEYGSGGGAGVTGGIGGNGRLTVRWSEGD